MKILPSHSRVVITLCAVCFAVSVLGAGPAHADIPSVLQNIVTMLTGQVARLLAIIAVIATGIAWMFGHMDLRKAAFVVLGIALIFGASEIVSTIAGA